MYKHDRINKYFKLYFCLYYLDYKSTYTSCKCVPYKEVPFLPLSHFCSASKKNSSREPFIFHLTLVPDSPFFHFSVLLLTERIISMFSIQRYSSTDSSAAFKNPMHSHHPHFIATSLAAAPVQSFFAVFSSYSVHLWQFGNSQLWSRVLVLLICILLLAHLSYGPLYLSINYGQVTTALTCSLNSRQWILIVYLVCSLGYLRSILNFWFRTIYPVPKPVPGT